MIRDFAKLVALEYVRAQAIGLMRQQKQLFVHHPRTSGIARATGLAAAALSCFTGVVLMETWDLEARSWEDPVWLSTATLDSTAGTTCRNRIKEQSEAHDAKLS
jgi:hypothetical protein